MPRRRAEETAAPAGPGTYVLRMPEGQEPRSYWGIGLVGPDPVTVELTPEQVASLRAHGVLIEPAADSREEVPDAV